jgi:hypothetical protein
MSKWRAVTIDEHRDGETHEIARGNMDGSWWVDWDRVGRFLEARADSLDDRPGVMMLKLLMAGRGLYPEVTFERSEQIAAEYGALVGKPEPAVVPEMVAKGGFW